MNRLTTLGIIAVVLFWTASCAALRPSYTIIIENSSGVDIRDAHVYWDGFTSVGGSLGSGGYAVHHYIQSPLPARLMVRWRTPDGVTHREEVASPKGVPRRFQGTLRFELLPDGHVEVRVDS